MAAVRVTAPASYHQPSRKGKKAWRKNVDITEVQSGLENVREEIIRGGVVAEKEADQLFATDLVGDAEIEKKQKPRKLLKSEQILGQRSAVPGLEGRKRKANDPPLAPSEGRKKYKSGGYVSHKDLQRLRSVADNAAGGVTIEEPSTFHDPWAETTEVTQDPTLTYLDPPIPTREPRTLKHAPLPLSATGKPYPSVPKPAAGKSYNPLVTDWSALLTHQGELAVDAEKRRLALEAAEAEQTARAQAEAEKVDAQDRDDAYGTDYESAWESEWDGIQSGGEGEDGEVHHVAKQPRRKTPAERNKVKARKEREAREKWERKQRERDEQEKRIAVIAKEMAARDRAKKTSRPALTAADSSASVSDNGDREEEEVMFQRRRFGQNPLPDAPLEVVLPDELQDSLLRLKPEGNLLTDRYRNLLVNGKVEVRKKVWQRRQRRTERTEKWSYKDWKLR
ncbi:hypothetical protein BAUCODRAFT_143135 [Baudoinia panamericana UAMH 10762]|uniref:Ribosome biogenesis protein NOP53 n=1 Tax=Baudoinia panamericana (strain UAMH 10762) TaxID=717646 RepID=M2MZ47_BAUPA|nr:uncharacterized protein BAUCODRAFT_143135 [Baudoinia panamericana UAMH 10762]EMC91590.1 hypothetical protein BAUCODRAFT_143135 [Baudoinia panamericana UAMH 10762]